MVEDEFANQAGLIAVNSGSHQTDPRNRCMRLGSERVQLGLVFSAERQRIVFGTDKDNSMSFHHRKAALR